jgi:hypothetical protein
VFERKFFDFSNLYFKRSGINDTMSLLVDYASSDSEEETSHKDKKLKTDTPEKKVEDKPKPPPLPDFFDEPMPDSNISAESTSQNSSSLKSAASSDGKTETTESPNESSPNNRLVKKAHSLMPPQLWYAPHLNFC